MARPLKDRSERRSQAVRAHVRPVEFIRIRQAAIRSRLSLSEYARARLLGEPIKVKQTQAIDPKLYDELRRIGVNLNQAVHRFHATGRAPPQLIKAAAAVERFLMDEIDGSEGGG